MLGHNMFAYCRNNPVNRKDAAGTDDCSATHNDDDDPLNDIGGGEYRGSGCRASGSNTGRSGAGGKASRNSGGASFRKNLQIVTGKDGKCQHAHHVFPQKYTNSFGRIGVKVNDPKNGAWWDGQSHLENSYTYNQWWEAFFSIEGVTAADAYAVADFLAVYFGFDWSR